MANELRDACRTALAAIAAEIDEAAVTVKYKSETATGIRAVSQKASETDILGELGMATNLVRVSAGAITNSPERGDTLIVDGNKVWCVMNRLDPAGACYVIEYSEQQIAMD